MSNGYIASAIGGAVMGVVAVAIPFGLGFGANVLGGALAGGAAAAAIGSTVGTLAAIGVGYLLARGIASIGFYMMTGHDGYKHSTMIPTLIGAGALTFSAITGQSLDPNAERVPAPVTESFNDACKDLKQINTKDGVALVIPKGCKVQMFTPEAPLR